MSLIAQSSPLPSPLPSPPLGWILIVCGVTLLLSFFLVLALLLRHARQQRHLLHLERMRSIEAGYPLQTTDPAEQQTRYLHNAFWIAFWMGFGVPAAAFSAAAATTQEIDEPLGLGIAIWISAAAASVAAVICATILMAAPRITRGSQAAPVPKPSMASTG